LNPRVEEFTKFHTLLMQGAPPNYIPHYFKLSPNSKAPLPGRSWKAKHSRLTPQQAIKWMQRGGNIGIAGMPDDPLVIVDLDGDQVDPRVLKPTLTVRSRSRTGIHGFYFSDKKTEIPNIPTDNMGEVRCKGQYVVAAGSYVPTDPSKVPEDQRSHAGYYTVEDTRPPAKITFPELPKIFKDAWEKRKAAQAAKKPEKRPPIKTAGRKSAVFDITAEEVVLRTVGAKKPTERWGSIFHDSTTEANMSISKDGLLHCWRHNVTHNGFTALVVLSGYMTCAQAGKPHGGGQFGVYSDLDGAILHAWLYAKKHNYIPEDDPIPTRALNYIARKILGYKNKEDTPLPLPIYIKALKIAAEEL